MKSTIVKVGLFSLFLLNVASFGQAATWKERFERKETMTLASSKLTNAPTQGLAFAEDTAPQQGMLMTALDAAVDNVRETSFKHWSAVAIFDFKHDQWLSGAMTNVFLVEKYAFHGDFGYAQPLQNMSKARGSILLGGSVHLDETQWFPAVTQFVSNYIPFLPSKLNGLLQYTTVGGIVGYDLDRSIEDNGHYSFIDGAFYGVYVGLAKKFGGPSDTPQ